MTTSRQRTERPARPGRRAWWIVGGVLTAAALLLALATAGVWIWTTATPKETDSHREVYDGPVAGIDVEVPVGTVSLTSSGGQDLEVQRDLAWKGPEPGVSEQLRADDTFEARADCDGHPIFWIGSGDTCTVDYAIDLPAGAAAEARSGVGDVHADGLDGDIHLEAAVGKVDAQNLSTTGAYVQADNGDVVLSFDEVLGDIEVVTGVGDVTILVPDDGTVYDVRSESGVGEEDIGIATDPTAEADHVITVTSGVGDIEIRYAS